MSAFQKFMRFNYLMLALIVGYVGTVGLHEIGHYEEMRKSGIENPIMSFDYLGDYLKTNLKPADFLFERLPVAGKVSAPIDKLPKWTQRRILLAGGFYAAIFSFVFWFIAWRTREKWGLWVEAVFFSLMMTQFLYAFTELIFVEFGWVEKTWHIHNILAAITTIFAQLLFYRLYAVKMIRFIGFTI